MGNNWVIPDIHGCINTLKYLIEGQIQPIKSDHLYFLGDYIDRGPGSKAVIDYLISLEKQNYQTHFLMGNHEAYFLKAFKHDAKNRKKVIFGKKNKHKKAWFAHGGKTCLKSFGVKQLNDIPEYYIKWMKALKHYFILQNHVLVHAGLNFKNDDPFEDKFEMLWARDFEINPEKINHRVIIHGHVPVHIDSIKKSVENNDARFIDLDNGVYKSGKEGFGKLTAYELTSNTLLIQDNLDL